MSNLFDNESERRISEGFHADYYSDEGKAYRMSQTPINDVTCTNCDWTGTDETAEQRVGDSACPECGETKLADIVRLDNMFHEFEIVNRKTGTAMQLTGIGKTRGYAANIIKTFNFAGLDFENDYELRHPDTLGHYTGLLNELNAELAEAAQ